MRVLIVLLGLICLANAQTEKEIGKKVETPVGTENLEASKTEGVAEQLESEVGGAPGAQGATARRTPQTRGRNDVMESPIVTIVNAESQRYFSHTRLATPPAKLSFKPCRGVSGRCPGPVEHNIWGENFHFAMRLSSVVGTKEKDSLFYQEYEPQTFVIQKVFENEIGENRGERACRAKTYEAYDPHLQDWVNDNFGIINDRRQFIPVQLGTKGFPWDKMAARQVKLDFNNFKYNYHGQHGAFAFVSKPTENYPANDAPFNCLSKDGTLNPCNGADAKLKRENIWFVSQVHHCTSQCNKANAGGQLLNPAKPYWKITLTVLRALVSVVGGIVTIANGALDGKNWENAAKGVGTVVTFLNVGDTNGIQQVEGLAKDLTGAEFTEAQQKMKTDLCGYRMSKFFSWLGADHTTPIYDVDKPWAFGKSWKAARFRGNAECKVGANLDLNGQTVDFNKLKRHWGNQKKGTNLVMPPADAETKGLFCFNLMLDPHVSAHKKIYSVTEGGPRKYLKEHPCDGEDNAKCRARDLCQMRVACTGSGSHGCQIIDFKTPDSFVLKNLAANAEKDKRWKVEWIRGEAPWKAYVKDPSKQKFYSSNNMPSNLRKPLTEAQLIDAYLHSCLGKWDEQLGGGKVEHHVGNKFTKNQIHVHMGDLKYKQYPNKVFTFPSAAETKVGAILEFAHANQFLLGLGFTLTGLFAVYYTRKSTADTLSVTFLDEDAL